MAHPKRRTSKAVKGKRRSHLGIKPVHLVRDPRTGAARLPHRLHDEDTHYGVKKGGEGGFEVRSADDDI